MKGNMYEKAINDATCIRGYVVDKDTYDLEHINSYLKRDLAIAQDDDFYVGKKCYRIIYRAKRPCEFCNMHVMKLGETRKWYKKLKKEKKHVAMSDSLKEINGKICFIQAKNDITEEVSQMLNMQNVANLDRAVKSCTRVLTEATDLKSSNSKLLKIVSDFYSSDSAYLYEYDQSNNSFELTNTHYSDKTSNKVTKTLELDDQTSYELLNNDYITLTREAHENLDYFKALAGSDVDELLLTAIKSNDVISGIIGINNFDEEGNGFELMSMVSSFVSNNLSVDNTKKQLDTTLTFMEESMDSNMVMLDCVKALVDDSGKKGGEGSIEHLLSVLQKYYKADKAYLFECDMENRYIKNINECLNNNVVSCVPTLKSLDFDRILNWCEHIQEHHHILMNDCKTMVDSTTEDFKLIIKNDINSIMMVPLTKDNTLVGIMAVENLNDNIKDISLLKSVSSFIVSHMNKVEVVKNLEELSFNDELTGLYNRNFYISYIEQLTQQTHKKMGIIFADVNGLKKANDNYGHEFGDVLIKWCSNFLRKNTDSLMFRVGGDEFICFFENVTNVEFEFCIRRLEYEMDKQDRKFISFGSTWRETNTDIEGQIAETDMEMYKSKQRFYEEKKANPVDEKQDLLAFKECLLKMQKEI